jgi:transcriptional regulator with XRE-family HTH domain
MKCDHNSVIRLVIMSLAKTVSKNIRMVRKQQSLSQEDLAKKARISVSYVSMLERGARVPPLGTIEVLAKSLGVAPLYLCQELSAPRSARAGR